MKNKNVTIYDIAKEANVSPATVSRVLTGNARVRPETMKKIVAIIEKHQFRPNELARSLLYKKSKMLGFILPDITSPFFSTLVLKSESYALKNGYSSFVCNSMNSREMESKYLQTLLEKQVDGIVFLGGRINNVAPPKEQIEELKQVIKRVPVVLVNGSLPDLDAPIIRSDEGDGVKQLVQLAIQKGHTKIGFLGGTVGVTSYELKLAAFEEEMKKVGLPFNKEWIIPDSFSIASGEIVIEKLILTKEMPTAILCANDYVAMGAINQLQKHGYEVPTDISVLGFDDMYISQYFPPGITTISQNYERLGQTAIEVLLNMIEGKEVEKETIIPTTLIHRQSCL
ncbi:putative transcriptional regulator [Bacillus sp. TS-2]|nr:putative transcriptional regulator [Bacillus sp. TS-2]